jgi:hypothetical protein
MRAAVTGSPLLLLVKLAAAEVVEKASAGHWQALVLPSTLHLAVAMWLARQWARRHGDPQQSKRLRQLQLQARHASAVLLGG